MHEQNEKIDILMSLPEMGAADQIMGYLRITDLLAMQTVSKDWKDISDKTLDRLRENKEVISYLGNFFDCFSDGKTFFLLGDKNMYSFDVKKIPALASRYSSLQDKVILRTSNFQDFYHVPCRYFSGQSYPDIKGHYMLYADSFGFDERDVALKREGSQLSIVCKNTGDILGQPFVLIKQPDSLELLHAVSTQKARIHEYTARKTYTLLKFLEDNQEKYIYIEKLIGVTEQLAVWEKSPETSWKAIKIKLVSEELDGLSIAFDDQDRMVLELFNNGKQLKSLNRSAQLHRADIRPSMMSQCDWLPVQHKNYTRLLLDSVGLKDEQISRGMSSGEIKECATYLFNLNFLSEEERVNQINQEFASWIKTLCAYSSIDFLSMLPNNLQMRVVDRLLSREGTQLHHIAKSGTEVRCILERIPAENRIPVLEQEVMQPEFFKSFLREEFALMNLLKILPDGNDKSELLDRLRENYPEELMAAFLSSSYVLQETLPHIPAANRHQFLTSLCGSSENLLSKLVAIKGQREYLSLFEQAQTWDLFFQEYDENREAVETLIASDVYNVSTLVHKLPHERMGELLDRLRDVLPELTYTGHSAMVLFSYVPQDYRKQFIEIIGAQKLITEINASQPSYMKERPFNQIYEEIENSVHSCESGRSWTLR